MSTSCEQARGRDEQHLGEDRVATEDAMTSQAVAFLREHGGDAARAALDRGPAVIAEELAKSRAEAIADAIATSLTVTEVAASLGLSRSGIAYRIRKRRLYSFTVDSRRYLPRWQFQPDDEPDRLEPIPGLERIVPAISDEEHPLGVQNFMTTPLLDFDGRSPAGYLGAGGPAQLVADWFTSASRAY